MGIESESMGLLAVEVDGSWLLRGLLGSVTGLKLRSVSLPAREETVVTSENSFKQYLHPLCQGNCSKMSELGQLVQLIPLSQIESHWLLVRIREVFQVNGSGALVTRSFDGASMHRQKRESLVESPFQSLQHLSRKPTAFSSHSCTIQTGQMFSYWKNCCKSTARKVSQDTCTSMILKYNVKEGTEMLLYDFP